MGRSFYIGPYLRVTKPLIRVIDRDPCEGHASLKGAKFCHICGLEKRPGGSHNEIDAGPGWFDPYMKDGKRMEFSDYLFSPSEWCGNKSVIKDGEIVRIDLYMPNRHYKELGIQHMDNIEEFPLDDFDMEKCGKLFVELFKSEIEHLGKYFLTEQKFGVVAYDNG